MPDHVIANRRYWDGELSTGFAGFARSRWAADEPYWGIWCIPQSHLPVLPDEVTGQVAVELGCGTGYVSAWLARRGALPVGVDNSRRQLATARVSRAELDLHGSTAGPAWPAARRATQPERRTSRPRR